MYSKENYRGQAVRSQLGKGAARNVAMLKKKDNTEYCGIYSVIGDKFLLFIAH
jgi:hypothetical protein